MVFILTDLVGAMFIITYDYRSTRVQGKQISARTQPTSINAKEDSRYVITNHALRSNVVVINFRNVQLSGRYINIYNDLEYSNPIGSKAGYLADRLRPACCRILRSADNMRWVKTAANARRPSAV